MSATTVTPPRLRVRRHELMVALERIVFALVPVVASLGLMAFMSKTHALAVDFRIAYYPAAHRLLSGEDTYLITGREVAAGKAFVYPALSAVFFAPFAAVHRSVGGFLYMLVCIACVPATLRVLDVRDWRIYGIAMLWLPVFGAWQTANLTLPLMFLVALAWRYRDRPVVAGLVTAVAISLKPFVWPLGLWLLVTRRWRAAAWAFGWGLLVNLCAWAIVGFDEIHAYLRLSGQVTDALWRGGYSMLAIAHHLGFGRGVGDVLLVALSAVVGVALVYKGLIKRQDREAMVLAVALMLVASPLVWSHYFALLLVPMALSRPRLSALWAAPLLMWVCPSRLGVAGWQVALAWAVCGGALLLLLRADRGLDPSRP